MKKQKESTLSSAKIAVIFFVILAVIICISLIFKIVLVVKAGQFDDSKRFTISISDSKSAQILSLSGEKTIAIIKLDKNIKPNDAGKSLKIPIDGFITSNLLDLSQKPASFFLSAILNYNNLRTNLTIIDILKLLFVAKSISDSAVNLRNIPQSSVSDADKIIGRLVSDVLIEKDGQTIQIINGTNITGLGNRLARLITNMGGNVIIVATSNSPQKKSRISFIDKETYTVKKLNKILKYDAVKENIDAVSDISIMIGEDRANSSPF